MPTYEYRCPDGHTFEVFQRMTDPPVEACEVCGGGPVERVLYPVAVHFKGSGFYSTDYGKGKKKRDADKDSSSTSSETTKTESKPDPASSEKGSKATTSD